MIGWLNLLLKLLRIKQQLKMLFFSILFYAKRFCHTASQKIIKESGK